MFSEPLLTLIYCQTLELHIVAYGVIDLGFSDDTS